MSNCDSCESHLQTASSPSTRSLARCTACDHVTACDRVWQGGGGEACAAAAGVAAEAMSHNPSRANLTTSPSRRVNGCKHSLLSCSAAYMNAGFAAFSLWREIPRRGGKQQVHPARTAACAFANALQFIYNCILVLFGRRRQTIAARGGA